jgi:flagellar biosynthetic protein FliR
MNISVTNLPNLLAFWLCFCKWSSFLSFAPLIDQIQIPVLVKALFFFLISYALYPFVSSYIVNDVNYMGTDNIFLLTVFYVVNGFVLGFLLKSIMFIFSSAGSLITQQIGFSSIQAFDPSFQAQVGPFEKLIVWTLSIMLVFSGVFNPIFKTALISFESTSITNLLVDDKLFHFFNFFMKKLIISALILSIPMLFISLLINSILGIVSRVVPQMNVLMISFVVNIGLGLLIFYFISDEFFAVSVQMYTDRLEDWFNFIK